MTLKTLLHTRWPLILSHLLLLVAACVLPVTFQWSIDTWESFQLLPLLALVVLLFILQQFYFLFSNQKSLTLITHTRALLICEVLYWALAIFYWAQTPGLTRYLLIIHWLLVHSYIIAQNLHPLLPVGLFGLQVVLFQANLNESLGKIIATGWLNTIGICVLIACYGLIATATLTTLNGRMKRALVFLALVFFILAGVASYFLTALSLPETLVVVVVPFLLSFGVMLLQTHPLARQHQAQQRGSKAA